VLALCGRLAQLPSQPAKEGDSGWRGRHSFLIQMLSRWSVTKPRRS
jgi:hypothetical protein